MSQKIKNLSLNLREYVKKEQTPQEIYDKLTLIWKKQPDYFRNYNPKDLIKLIFYIYSINETGSFSLGDKMINNLFFAALFNTINDPASSSCDRCEGSGEYNCPICDAHGYIDCEDCDGEGKVYCDACDGSGYGDEEEDAGCSDCNGTGKVRCKSCRNGQKRCPNCETAGMIPCKECEGTGEIETGEINLTMYSICTWDNPTADRLLLSENTNTPCFGYDYFYKIKNNKILILNFKDTSASLNFTPLDEDYYCYSTEDDPKLSYSYDMTIWPNNITFNKMSSYLK
jgi:hypothetical protein